eukprot:SAG22_NODE_600_length_8677_cov_18.222429_2_plen_181_part_00
MNPLQRRSLGQAITNQTGRNYLLGQKQQIHDFAAQKIQSFMNAPVIQNTLTRALVRGEWECELRVRGATMEGAAVVRAVCQGCVHHHGELGRRREHVLQVWLRPQQGVGQHAGWHCSQHLAHTGARGCAPSCPPPFPHGARAPRHAAHGPARLDMRFVVMLTKKTLQIDTSSWFYGRILK